jgi:hypothetical protein
MSAIDDLIQIDTAHFKSFGQIVQRTESPFREGNFKNLTKHAKIRLFAD